MTWVIKETGTARMFRDEKDVQKIEEQLKRFEVFHQSMPKLVSLATRDVATEEITTSLLAAEAKGIDKLTISKSSEATKVLKADRSLLHRLFRAQMSGRSIDVNELLKHELFPVPLSLADTSDKLY
ncbi:hypothetical protein KUTeg_001506 [Tegillarca granosa]|uniref:Uncharacterized protein n=1 Tax=Tegillarca granosa TaxID=220873 RepID=A0ABQ9FRM7_TEGGR|nr:hypothetical protein KUTeg_001506 [Tegillarca granosa]